MSCGSSTCASTKSQNFAPAPGALRHSFRRVLIRLGSMLYAARRRQVMIEIEKLRQRGLLTERDLRFISEAGLAHKQVERETTKSFSH
jgi:hypothetical protein